MLSINQKADYSTPGFDHAWNDGVLTGRLRTLFPIRFKTAWRKTWISALVLTFLIGIAGNPVFDGHAMLGAFVILIPSLYALFLSWEPGVAIKMTREHLIVGVRRYDLAHVGTINTEQTEYMKRFDNVLYFTYGRKKVRLRVRNAFKHQFDIALLLDSARKALLEQASTPETQAAPRIEARSAAF